MNLKNDKEFTNSVKIRPNGFHSLFGFPMYHRIYDPTKIFRSRILYCFASLITPGFNFLNHIVDEIDFFFATLRDQMMEVLSVTIYPCIDPL